jgi:hypothetical protein
LLPDENRRLVAKVGRDLLTHAAAQPGQEQDEGYRSTDGKDGDRDLGRLAKELTPGDRNDSMFRGSSHERLLWLGRSCASVASIPCWGIRFQPQVGSENY